MNNTKHASKQQCNANGHVQLRLTFLFDLEHCLIATVHWLGMDVWILSRTRLQGLDLAISYAFLLCWHIRWHHAHMKQFVGLCRLIALCWRAYAHGYTQTTLLSVVEWQQIVADSAYLFVLLPFMPAILRPSIVACTRQSQPAWQRPSRHPVFLLIYSSVSKHQIHFDTWLCASSSALQDLQHTNASSTSSIKPCVIPLRFCNTTLLRTLRIFPSGWGNCSKKALINTILYSWWLQPYLIGSSRIACNLGWGFVFSDSFQSCLCCYLCPSRRFLTVCWRSGTHDRQRRHLSPGA